MYEPKPVLDVSAFIFAVFARFVAICILFTELIGAEGARSSKMHSHFLRAVFFRGSLFNVLRE